MMNDPARKLDMELKKQKLAEIRENRRRQEEEKRRSLAPNVLSGLQNGARQTLSTGEIEKMLTDLGFAKEKQTKPADSSDEKPKINGHSSTPATHVFSTTSRNISLELTEPKTVVIPRKTQANYSKTTQTDDEKFSTGEFSIGSQDLDFDDDMLPTHKQFIDDASPSEELARLLPGFSFGRQRLDSEKRATEEEPPKLPDLSEEEKQQIVDQLNFQNFFFRASTVVERALAEDHDIFIDYTADCTDQVETSGERLTFRRSFVDDRFTRGRKVVAITFSEQHPELFAVAYDENTEKPDDPAGVVAVFNTKFKREAAEFIFVAQTRLTSVSFARFHSNLILAGCYTGQICVWDKRNVNKRTPINKSPLSARSHTQPVFALGVVGSHNAHNLVSISTDGKMCSWNVESLGQPVDMKILNTKIGSKQIPVVCMAFPKNDVNNFIVGSEDGSIYLISRHGTTSTNVANEQQLFLGHSAPVLSADFHRAVCPSGYDLSHLFLSTSSDWTINLWNIKDSSMACSFGAQTEYVNDVKWSPVHPAVFAVVDGDANLTVWNLNEDFAGPISRVFLGEEGASLQGRRVMFSDDGRFIITGDSEGVVKLFELQESLSNPRPEEWKRLAKALSDLKASREFAEQQTKDRLTQQSSVVAGLPSAASSSRLTNF